MERSNLHKNTLAIIKKCYPQEPITEELSIKVGKKVLYIDIYLPRLNIAIECDGIQHEKFNKFFHQDIYSFKAQVENDRKKSEYCEENGITLVRVSSLDKLDEASVTAKILEALRSDQNG